MDQKELSQLEEDRLEASLIPGSNRSAAFLDLEELCLSEACQKKLLSPEKEYELFYKLAKAERLKGLVDAWKKRNGSCFPSEAWVLMMTESLNLGLPYISAIKHVPGHGKGKLPRCCSWLFYFSDTEIEEAIGGVISDATVEFIAAKTDLDKKTSREVLKNFSLDLRMMDPLIVFSKDQEETRKYFEGIIEEGEEARCLIIESNLRLVVSIARRHLPRSNMELVDLIQEGSIGLMRSVLKFDHSMGNKFSTYATWWISQSVKRAISDKSRAIRLPVHAWDDVVRMRTAYQQLKMDSGEEPSIEEVSSASGFSPQKVEYLFGIGKDAVSLSRPVGEDGSELELFIAEANPQDPERSPEAHLEAELREEAVKNILNTLREKDRYILELRMGFKDGRSWTLEEIGKRLGVTRERVRQIEEKALRRLRLAPEKDKLKDFIV